MNRFLPAALFLLASQAVVSAQPTYKLGVRPEFAPKAEIKLEDGKVVRTPVANDPGFRLVFHIKMDGKSVARIEARSSAGLTLPAQEAGVFSVALELYFPTFKTGNAPKGEFKAISNVINYRVEDGKVAVLGK